MNASKTAQNAYTPFVVLKKAKSGKSGCFVVNTRNDQKTRPEIGENVRGQGFLLSHLLLEWRGKILLRPGSAVGVPTQLSANWWREVGVERFFGMGNF